MIINRVKILYFLGCYKRKFPKTIYLFTAVLKDVPNSPFELLKNPDMDAVRMGLFPSLDYKGLYNSIIPLIEVAPLIPYGLHGN